MIFLKIEKLLKLIPRRTESSFKVYSRNEFELIYFVLNIKHKKSVILK